jgi:hypothetical protein
MGLDVGVQRGWGGSEHPLHAEGPEPRPCKLAPARLCDYHRTMPKQPVVDAAGAEFARKVAELSAQLDTPQTWDGVYGLRAVEEEWARHLLGIEAGQGLHRLVQGCVERGIDLELAEQALLHLREAEHHQWGIGTTATGSGEGLASMAAVRELQTAQAWLEVSIARSRIARARQLAAEVEQDPNRMGKTYLRSLNALEALLAGPT